MQTSTSPKTTSNNFFYKLIRCTKLVYLYISSKTFNMAGLEIANIVIANDKYREQFKLALIAAGIHNPGYFSVPAFLCAYRHGDSWLAALKDYLVENRSWVQSFCQAHFPDWFVASGGGTYMLWIDYRAMNISEEQLRHWFVSLAGVEMSWGSDFGDEGLGFPCEHSHAEKQSYTSI